MKKKKKKKKKKIIGPSDIFFSSPPNNIFSHWHLAATLDTSKSFWILISYLFTLFCSCAIIMMMEIPTDGIFWGKPVSLKFFLSYTNKIIIRTSVFQTRESNKV